MKQMTDLQEKSPKRRLGRATEINNKRGRNDNNTGRQMSEFQAQKNALSREKIRGY